MAAPVQTRRLADLFPPEVLNRPGPEFPFCFDPDAHSLDPEFSFTLPPGTEPNTEFARTPHYLETSLDGFKVRDREHAKDAHGFSIHRSLPLVVASQFENPEAVHELVTQGARVDAFDRHGNRALQVALGRGCPRTARALLDHGASPHRMPGDVHSPLIQALHRHRDEGYREGAKGLATTAFLVSDLLAAGALLAPPGEEPLTLLDVWEIPALVALFLRYGADPNVATPVEKDEHGWIYGGETVLHKTASGRHPGKEQRITADDLEVARLVLEAGADLEPLNGWQQTPEYLADDPTWAQEDGANFLALLQAFRDARMLASSLPSASPEPSVPHPSRPGSSDRKRL